MEIWLSSGIKLPALLAAWFTTGAKVVNPQNDEFEAVFVIVKVVLSPLVVPNAENPPTCLSAALPKGDSM
jgi:hypothetical protein